MEEENKGISFKGICKTIWLKKWVALIVAVVVMLVCAISLFYGYSVKSRYYEIEFSLNLPGSSNGVTYIYPDGTQFNYASMTSKETLEEIKASNEEFADIDVEEMTSKGRIHISRDISVIANSSETASAIREITYTISARASYFSDKAQARKFLTALAKSPAEYLTTMNIENGVYLPLAKSAIDYETEIGFLKNQLEVLQEGYDELIKTYGGSFVGDSETGKTLLAYSQEVKAHLDSGVLDNLLIQLRKEHIVKSDKGQAYYADMQETLTRELRIKQDTLNNILKSDDTGSSVIIEVNANVLKLSQEVAELDEKIESLKKYYVDVPETDIKSDENFLNKEYKEVERLTNTYTDTCKNVYGKASAVVYTQSGVVVLTGGMSLIMVVLLSIVAGVLVAGVAAYAAGYLSLKKEKASAEAPLTTTPKEQSEAEAEASEKENKE